MKAVPKPGKKKAAARPRELTLSEQIRQLAKSSAAADRRSAAADRRMDEFARQAAADRKRMAEADRKADADREAADLWMREHIRKTDADREAADRRMDAFVRQAEADRKRMGEDHKKSEGHRRNLSRALEDTFAASLPRAMRAHRIVIRPRDIRMRVRKGRQSRELDFVAPNGKLVLIGEVKTRLTRSDVAEFSDMLQSEFRELFPEYAGLPVYGVVAGAGIDADAAALAHKRGVLHPADGGGGVAPGHRGKIPRQEILTAPPDASPAGADGGIRQAALGNDRERGAGDSGMTMTKGIPPMLLRGWIVPVGDAIPDRREVTPRWRGRSRTFSFR